MTKLQYALYLAEMGFYVFPCVENTKKALILDYSNRATRDPERIRDWWTDPILGMQRGHNIGISCARFGDGNEELVLADVDPKNGGDETELLLELDGKCFGDTFSQKTQSGGRHYCFTTQSRLRQGTGTVGRGIDSRNRGGYFLGAGSEIDGRPYLLENRTRPKPAPQWLVEVLADTTEIREVEVSCDINDAYALERANFYLTHEAPEAIEGQGGNTTTYKVVGRVRDFGVDLESAKVVLREVYNVRKCFPPWEVEALDGIVENVYNYAQNDIGALAPETQFTKIEDEAAKEEKLSPIKELNQRHAYIIIKGKYAIVHETTDPEGRDIVDFWSEDAFHSYYLSKKMQKRVGDNWKEVAVSREWMVHPDRRTYDGIVFKPEQKVDARWYNLWKGFSFKPSPEGTGEDHESVRRFKEHIEENICAGNPELARWVTGHFAHLIQKPYEKPLTALVFKGKKGTGKSALLKFVGALIQPYYRDLANANDMSNHFNSHLENCLALLLEEAFFSGDKRADAILKHLVTGDRHRIERKGLDAYYLPNLTRVYVIGNESWLVPASEDERRYCVLNVSSNRQGDWQYFNDMRLGFEKDGYPHLLRYLLDFDLTGLNFTVAPNTEALFEQKMASLDPVSQWWYESLSEGEVLHSGIEGWPESATKRQLHDAYLAYCQKQRNKKAFFDTLNGFLNRFEDIVGYLKRCRVMEDGEKRRYIKIPTLAEARDRWDERMKFKVKWEDEI